MGLEYVKGGTIIQRLFADYKKQLWVKVDERATLYSVISRPDHIVSGIPGMVFPFVVTSFLVSIS